MSSEKSNNNNNYMNDFSSSPLQTSYINFLTNQMNGMSVLHYGAKHGHVDVVDLLLDTGAAGDVYAEDHAGWTPLHHAAANGQKKVVELLLEKINHGAGAWQVNAKTKNGSTPLALAISSSKLDVAYILLDHGALLHDQQENNECCKNNKGKTPLDMAPTPEIKAALLEYRQQIKEKLVMHQIDKLLCSVKTGRIALVTNLNHYNTTTTDMMMMQQQRAGKRPRPRW